MSEQEGPEARVSDAETATYTGPQGAGPFLFVRGEFFDLGSGTPVSVGKVPLETSGPPKATPFGLLVELGESGDPSDLWVVKPDGTSERVVTGTRGFGVSSDGSRIVYALNESTSVSEFAGGTLRMSSLPEISLQASSSRIEGPVHVVGLFGGGVVFVAGDGADVTDSIWDPESDSLTALEYQGVVRALDPVTGRALLTQGDGPCWQLGTLVDKGEVSDLGSPDCETGLASPVFSPDGTLVAGIAWTPTEPELTQPSLLIVKADDANPVFEKALPGIYQVVWETEKSALVLAMDPPGHHTVYRCDLAALGCEEVWTQDTGATEPGMVWLVQPWL